MKIIDRWKQKRRVAKVAAAIDLLNQNGLSVVKIQRMGNKNYIVNPDGSMSVIGDKK